jgi:hypothetical protein
MEVPGTRSQLDYDSVEYVQSLTPLEINISRRLEYGRGPLRYAEMRMEDGDGVAQAVVKGEIVLRRTSKGARSIKAQFLEFDRRVYQLTLQYFTERTGRPHTSSFPLRGDEIELLLNFVEDLKRVHLTPGRLVIEPGALEHERFTDDALVAAIRKKPDLAAEIVETNATSRDVKAIAYRRRSLERFAKLLEDDDYFDEEVRRDRSQSPEHVWQSFFEENQWIFGYGLSYIFLSSVDANRLKAAVSGYSIAWKGKEPDAVMKTRGAVSALCLIELKTHRTSLVRPKPTRSGAFGPHQDLTDAISQSQASVMGAERQLREIFTPTDAMGDPLSEPIYNYRPRAYLVAGRLSEFHAEHGINAEKFGSFEAFRRSLTSPEIITFDELYERAAFIVDHPV